MKEESKKEIWMDTGKEDSEIGKMWKKEEQRLKGWNEENKKQKGERGEKEMNKKWKKRGKKNG